MDDTAVSWFCEGLEASQVEDLTERHDIYI